MSSWRAWVLAARPPTLWAAVSPVLVGSALAVADDVFRPGVFAATLFAAIALQVGVNFANDVSDAGRGADTAARIGPPRAVATGLIPARAMWTGVWVAFGAAVAAGLYLTAVAGPVVVVIGVASIAAALAYTGGPLPYGYRGLGEVFVFLFFGLVATVGSRYVHDRTAPGDAWLLAIPVGLGITAILVANNIRDIASDMAAGKRTLAVMLGRQRTAILYGALLGAAGVATIAFPVAGLVPGGAAWGLAVAPAAVLLARSVAVHTSGPELIGALRGTARLQAAYGVLVAAGIALPAL